MRCPKISTSKAVPSAAAFPLALTPPNLPSGLPAAIAPHVMPGAGCQGAAAAVKEGLHSLIFSFQTTSCWSRGIWQSSANLSLVPGWEGKSAAGSPAPHRHSGGGDPTKILLQKLSECDPTARAAGGPSRARASVNSQQSSVSEWFSVCWCRVEHPTPPWGHGWRGHPCGAHFTITEQHGVPLCRALVGTVSSCPSPPRPGLHTPG